MSCEVGNAEVLEIRSSRQVHQALSACQTPATRARDCQRRGNDSADYHPVFPAETLPA